MKIKSIISLVLFVSSLSYPQQNIFNKEIELNKFILQGGKVEEISTNLYKLTYRTGETKVFSFEPEPAISSAGRDFLGEGMDSTIFNFIGLDTLLYYKKFSFWQKVDIGCHSDRRVFVEDINKNNRLELYGFSKSATSAVGPVEIYEQNNAGIFKKVYTYDSTSDFVLGIGDINSDGTKEVHIKTEDTMNGKFYKSDSLGSLPTKFDFVFYPINTPYLIRDLTFGDFDKNGITDYAFILYPFIYIAEYDSIINNFTQVYEDRTSTSPSGFAIGDFDQDGKTDLAFGITSRKIYVIENIGNRQYSIVWDGITLTPNAYMKAATNDIDGNDKPEFWIGGANLSDYKSRFICYEANGNNSYKPVAYIEINIISLSNNTLQSEDIDDDGKDELIINIGDWLIILKFAGSPNHHSYEIFYVKIKEKTQAGAYFCMSTIYDFNGDGKKDILLPMTNDFTPTITNNSYILIQNTSQAINEGGTDKTSNYNIEQNYPNPFNPTTSITYQLSAPGFVSLKVYDMLGREVATLVNEMKESGSYSSAFSASNLASGVYVYRISITDGSRNIFSDTKRMLLI
ncbi:MAG: T9SS type A sorting domain-containing protein, partial [Bacteroidetes bacterium]